MTAEEANLSVGYGARRAPLQRPGALSGCLRIGSHSKEGASINSSVALQNPTDAHSPELNCHRDFKP
jgi:hypothetical protein